MFCRVLLGVALLALCAPAQAARPEFWRIEQAKDYLSGDLEGLAVDSDGRLRVSSASRLLADTETPFVWSLVRDGKGVLYAGTGNDGKILRIEGEEVSLLYAAPELEVHALAIGSDGRVYAGTSPDGKVYAIDAEGNADVFFDPVEKYIWALAFDRGGNLLVATGIEGKLHRVDREGNGETILSTAETHLTALTVDDEGNAFVGSTPGGIVYRVGPDAKAFVLHDSAYREVKSLAWTRGRGLFVAAIDAQGPAEPRPPQPSPAQASPPTPTTSTEITVTATPSPQPAPTPPPAPPPPPAAPGRTRGAVIWILPGGDVETLWTSTEEMPHSLGVAPGGVLVGTGNAGKVYQLRTDRSWTMVGVFSSQQVTSLCPGAGGETFLATSNPGLVYSLGSGPGASGRFTSQAKDTGTVSTWGRLRWQASSPDGARIEAQTRSGNTGTPDDTWSEWSQSYTEAVGSAISSPRARFLQLRFVLSASGAGSPVVESVSAAYLQRNLRPRVASVTVHPPGVVYQRLMAAGGQVRILGMAEDEPREPSPSGGPTATRPPPRAQFSRQLYRKGLQTISWKASDPNRDSLVYAVHYRPLHDRRYRLLRERLEEAVMAWDTTTVPNGRYLVRVTASDSRANPATLALAGEKESTPFDVDNTPPSVSAALEGSSPPRVRAVVRDDSSLVQKAEYSVNGGRWQEVYPTDGISDSLEETYEIDLEVISGPGPHVLVVRARDRLGNVATARVRLP